MPVQNAQHAGKMPVSQKSGLFKLHHYGSPMKICVALILFVALLLFGGCSQAVTKAQPAMLVPVMPIPVVRLQGDGAQIGSEHAAKLGEQIRSLHAQYLEKWFASPAQRFLATAAARGFEQHLLPEHRAELHALAEGTGIDADQMMLAQCFLDLSPMTACSTVALPADAAPDGVARMGRNLDFPSFNLADKQSVVLIVRPEGKYAFAAVSWPGLMGVLSGMNEHGLTLTNMEVTRSGSIPVAMPYTLLYRAILEQCRTVDEAIDLLQRSMRQTANNLMLMDADGNRAVVEIQPRSITVRRGQPGQALMSTNHQRAQDADTAGLCPRYDALHQMSQHDFGQIDVSDLERMMAQVAQGNFTLQSMVFEPSNRVMYLAVGRNAPNASAFYRLDLRAMLSNHDE